MHHQLTRPARWLRGAITLAVVCTVASAVTSAVTSTAYARPAAPPPPPPMRPPTPDVAPAKLPELTPVGVPYKTANDAQKEAARNAHKAGLEAEKAGDLKQAVGRFRQAHGVVAHPKMRLKIVQTLSAMGRFGEAYDEARLLIKDADMGATQDDKLKQTAMDARDELRGLGERVGFIKLTAPPAAGSELRVNGRLIAPAAWAQPIAVEPGEVQIVAGNQQASASVTQGQEVGVTLSAAAAQTKPPETPSGSGYDGPDRRMMAIIAGGVGILGLTSFGVFGAVSQGQFDRLESGCDDPDFCDRGLESVRDRGVATQTGANVSLGIGLVALAAGAGLFTWDLLDPAVPDDDVAVRPTLRVGLGSLSIQGSF